MKDHDAGPVMAFLAKSDDIALIELKQPVRDISPVALYTGSDEASKIAGQELGDIFRGHAPRA